MKYRTLQDIIIPRGTEFTASGRQARAIPFGEALVIVSLGRDYAAGFVLPVDQPGSAVFESVEESSPAERDKIRRIYGLTETELTTARFGSGC